MDRIKEYLKPQQGLFVRRFHRREQMPAMHKQLIEQITQHPLDLKLHARRRFLMQRVDPAHHLYSFLRKQYPRKLRRIHVWIQEILIDRTGRRSIQQRRRKYSGQCNRFFIPKRHDRVRYTWIDQYSVSRIQVKRVIPYLITDLPLDNNRYLKFLMPMATHIPIKIIIQMIMIDL